MAGFQIEYYVQPFLCLWLHRKLKLRSRIQLRRKRKNSRGRALNATNAALMRKHQVLPDPDAQPRNRKRRSRLQRILSLLFLFWLPLEHFFPCSVRVCYVVTIYFTLSNSLYCTLMYLSVILRKESVFHFKETIRVESDAKYTWLLL